MSARKRSQTPKKKSTRQPTTSRKIQIAEPAAKTEARHDLFVLEYLKDFNATRAAKAVGYAEKNASVVGSDLIRNPTIQMKLAEALTARKDRLRIDADEVLRELTILCRSDVRDFRVRESGKLTLRKGAPDTAWRAVSSVKHRIRTVQMNNGQRQVIREVEVRLWSKTEALALARKHLGLDRDDNGKVDPFELAAAMRQHLRDQDAKEGLSEQGDPDA